MHGGSLELDVLLHVCEYSSLPIEWPPLTSNHSFWETNNWSLRGNRSSWKTFWSLIRGTIYISILTWHLIPGPHHLGPKLYPPQSQHDTVDSNLASCIYYVYVPLKILMTYIHTLCYIYIIHARSIHARLAHNCNCLANLHISILHQLLNTFISPITESQGTCSDTLF